MSHRKIGVDNFELRSPCTYSLLLRRCELFRMLMTLVLSVSLKSVDFEFLSQPDDTVTLIDAAVDTNDLYLYASSEESELESDGESRYFIYSYIYIISYLNFLRRVAHRQKPFFKGPSGKT